MTGGGRVGPDSAGGTHGIGGKRAVRGISVVVCCLVAAGCGGSDGGGAASAGETTSMTAPSGEPAGGPGPMLGVCGSVSDDELITATGITADLHIVRDPVGCQWDTGDLVEGSHVSFTWYRGSPIGRERTIDGAVGRNVQDLTIDGRPGFSSQSGATLCEVGVGYGDDFFLWSVAYGAAPPNGDVCDVARSLATTTAERARA